MNDQDLRMMTWQERKDAERYRWLRDNGAVVVSMQIQRSGYRSTMTNAPYEHWFEHGGWSVSTLPMDAVFPTMDAAVDEARRQAELKDE